MSLLETSSCVNIDNRAEFCSIIYGVSNGIAVQHSYQHAYYMHGI